MRTVITFRVEYEGEIIEVKTCEGEYRNLMALLNDKMYIECFGECGGMGRCGTCLVVTNNCKISKATTESNEYTTLFKNSMAKDNIRLSCQIPITTEIENAFFEIKNQTNF
jgi:2Fe-2S ferredoxin